MLLELEFQGGMSRGDIWPRMTRPKDQNGRVNLGCLGLFGRETVCYPILVMNNT